MSADPAPAEQKAPAQGKVPVSRSRCSLKLYQWSLVLGLATIFFGFSAPKSFEYVLWPVLYVLNHLGFRDLQPAWHFPLTLLSAYIWCFILWLSILWAVSRSSLGFKISLIGCITASSALWWAWKVDQESVDWTSRGLNPARPGFKSQVLLLAGTFDYQVTGIDTGQRYTGVARFEIRMRGADYYYSERWQGYQWKYGSWDVLNLSLPEFSGTWHRSYSGSGHHGGGSSSKESDPELLVGRRLWHENEFTGATTTNAFCQEGATECFLSLKQFGPYLIPEVIDYSKGDRHEVFRVRRVEFLSEPSTNWFWRIQQKYFGADRQRFWSTNLNEAGWSGEDKPK